MFLKRDNSYISLRLLALAVLFKVLLVLKLSFCVKPDVIQPYRSFYRRRRFINETDFPQGMHVMPTNRVNIPQNPKTQNIRVLSRINSAFQHPLMSYQLTVLFNSVYFSVCCHWRQTQPLLRSNRAGVRWLSHWLQIQEYRLYI